MARQKNLSVLHATLPVSQRANALAFSAHRTYPLFYTSAPDWQSGITCHFCSRHRHPACQRAHARMGRAARAVLNHGVSPHTPSYYDDRIVQNFSLLRRAISEWRDRTTFQPCTRRRHPACQKANAPTFSAHRTYPLFYTSAPDWQSSITCHFCSRRRHPVYQKAHARMGRAARAVLNHGVSPHTPSYYDDRIVQNFSLLRRAIPE